MRVCAVYEREAFMLCVINMDFIVSVVIRG